MFLWRDSVVVCYWIILYDKDIMNAKLLGAEWSQTPWKTNSIVPQDVFDCVAVFEEQNLNHENILSVNTGKIQPLKHRLEEENITHPMFQASLP